MLMISERFNQIVSERGLTAQEIAKNTGIKKAKVERLFIGDTSKLYTNEVEILAGYFNVSVDYMLGLEEG